MERRSVVHCIVLYSVGGRFREDGEKGKYLRISELWERREIIRTERPIDELMICKLA